MENKEPDLDVQSEDWERQPSEPTDLGPDDSVSKARFDERIRAVENQLLRHDGRITRIEEDIKTVKCDLEKDIERVEDNHNRLVKYLWGGIALIFTAAVSIIIALINRGN